VLLLLNYHFLYAVYQTLEITKEDMKKTINKDTNKTINKRGSRIGSKQVLAAMEYMAR
jgi:hypothetical protein